ncbi:hypothetical protein ARTSIC4J27_2093 [Pseudarthrobacter siccitolerans]|uniref:Uncharacterized protein n=1 Tax=Pseudarthrobacter siccitolerans TaxID=861266 RepID=A0A024H294_9MICC|nr:hypothetical protein [Pseudarthrobacter siccitolerans]CCQ46133.1 hypothetical protein ARTSIC4J27_2093 [Pseudarthrobacter siccitolerans]
MSLLEISAMPILTQSPCRGRITDDEATILARWFAKTAVNLNVSQPFRLLVDEPSRHALVSVPDGFAVHLFRVRKQNGVFDWVQKAPDAASCSQAQLGGMRRLMELTLVTHIRIADHVAVVVHVPEPLRSRDVVPEGTARIYPLPDRLPT